MLASLFFQAALIVVSLLLLPEYTTTGYAVVAVFLGFGPFFLWLNRKEKSFAPINKIYLLICILVVVFCNLSAHADRYNKEQRMLMVKKPSFHFDSNSGLLSEEELEFGWAGGRYTFGPVKYDFSFTDQETLALREFILSNKELCIVGVGREYNPGPVRVGFDLLWSVPQAWWHFRKDTCKLGIVSGHGNESSLNVFLGEDLFAGISQQKFIPQSRIKEDYPGISLLFIQCRGEGAQSKSNGEIFEENGYYYSSKMGNKTHGDWLKDAFRKGELQRLVQKIKLSR